MKKFGAILLVLACVFTMFSCGSDSTVEKVSKMFNSVAPTKVVAVTTEALGDTVLTSSSTFLSGRVGGKAAATYEFTEMRLRDIEEGSGDQEMLPWYEVKGLYEYHEDKGVRIDGGKWQDDMYNFSPTVGSVELNIEKKFIKDAEEDETARTIKFTVLAANTEAVFGVALECDVAVTVTHDGSAVTGLELNYTVPASGKNHPDIVTCVSVRYSYDVEQIDIK